VEQRPPSFSVAVYCGSRTGLSPSHQETARLLGRWIGSRNGELIYGGGSQGLMGVLANATLAAGGRVTGVIPESMVQREWAHHGISELIIVQSMHERKAAMLERADAVLAIPGGIGTLDEFFEAWTWRQLGYHHKPIGLLNVDGYFDGLLAFIRQAIEQDFLRTSHLELLTHHSDIESLMPALLDAIVCP
jgi:uncharacterized protein (TIGR00730 family)